MDIQDKDILEWKKELRTTMLENLEEWVGECTSPKNITIIMDHPSEKGSAAMIGVYTRGHLCQTIPAIIGHHMDIPELREAIMLLKSALIHKHTMAGEDPMVKSRDFLEDKDEGLHVEESLPSISALAVVPANDDDDGEVM